LKFFRSFSVDLSQFVWKTAPADERITFGEVGSALLIRIRAASNPRQRRRIVPTLPGSWILSSTTMQSCFFMSSSL